MPERNALSGSGGLGYGFGGRLRCGTDGLALDTIFATEQSSCTANPCSSTMHDSSETVSPHIQHTCGSFELAATSRLQLAR